MDWTTLIIGALIGALVAIPFSIFGNIATPWVRSYFEKRKLTTLERKRFVLLDEYRKRKEYRLFPLSLVLRVINMLSAALFGFAFMIMLVGSAFLVFAKTNNINLTLAAFMLPWLLLVMISIITTLVGKEIYDVSHFYGYRKVTIEELIKLGCNPEELDKIDREFEETETETEKKPVKTRRG